MRRVRSSFRCRASQLAASFLLAVLAIGLPSAAQGEIARFEKHTGPVRAIAVSADGRQVATAGADGMCYVLEASSLKPLHALGPQRTELTGVAISADGTVVVSSKLGTGAAASVFFWDARREKIIRSLADTKLNTFGLILSPDASQLAVRLDRNAVRLYLPGSGGRIGLPPPGDDTCFNLAFSPDNRILSICNGLTIHHLQFTDGRPALLGKNMSVNGSQATAVSFMPDGKRIISGQSDGQLLLRPVGSDQVAASFNGHRGAVTSVMVSRDGKRLASSGEDGTVRVWNFATGRAEQTWQGHAGRVNQVAFVGAQTVVSAGEDKTVRLWSLETGGQVSGSKPVALATREPAKPTLQRAVELRKAGSFDEAVEIFKTLGSESVKTLGIHSSRTLSLMRQLAETRRASGQYDEAAKLYLRCFQESEPTITRQSVDAPDDVVELARTYSAQGNDAAAIKGLTAVARRRAEKLGPKHPAVSDAHFGLGELYTQRKEWPLAIEHLQACLDIRRVKLGRQHEDLVPPLLLLGECYRRGHEAHQGEAALKEAVQICLQHYTDNDWRTAEAKSRLGDLYANTGRPKDAGPLTFANAERVMTLGLEESPSSIDVRSRYASGLNVVGMFDKAHAAGRQALDLARRTFGPQDFRVAEILLTLAWTNVKLNRMDEALRLYDEAQSIFLRRFGKDAWQCDVAFGATASVHYMQGDYEKAEADYQRAIELLESRPGGPETTAFSTYQNLAGLHVSKNQFGTAAKWFGRCARSMRASLYAHIPVLPDEVKFTYATVIMSYMRRPFSDAVTHRSDAQLCEGSAEWIVNLKGFVAEVLAQRNDVGRGDDDPQTRRLLRELARTRQQLAAMSVSLLQQRDTSTMEALREQEREIAAQLGAQTRQTLNSESWTTLDQVRETLDDDTVLVEFLQFRYEPLLQGMTPQNVYVAWVIPPAGKGKVELVLLGNQEEIDELIAEYRREMERSAEVIALAGEARAEQHLQRVTQRLSAVLVQNLPALAGYKRWFLSPDGALWLVPFSAMQSRDGKYVAERHEVSYLVTSRQLTWPSKRPATKNRAVVFANPDYDDKVRPVLRGAVFGALPGTEREAKAVVPSLKEYTSSEPVLMLGKLATEARVKTLGSPQVLMLSTHGYFDELDKEAEGSTAAQNPLLRCGLALSGANGSIASKDRVGNDGILTGLEVTSLDLRGTELVVLSACQTGLGDIHRGEGVSGLRQAFQLAGAQAVVATLWSIPDEETADLMSQFFGELTKSATPAQALQKSQQAIITQRRQQHSAAHPFFWSAFGVTRTGN